MADSSLPSDVLRYTNRIKEILQTADLEVVSAKQIRKQIELEETISLSHYKKAIDTLIIQVLDQVLNEREQGTQNGDNSTEENVNRSHLRGTQTLPQQQEEENLFQGNNTNNKDSIPNNISNNQNLPSKNHSLEHTYPNNSNHRPSKEPYLSTTSSDYNNDEAIARRLQAEESGLRFRRTSAVKSESLNTTTSLKSESTKLKKKDNEKSKLKRSRDESSHEDSPKKKSRGGGSFGPMVILSDPLADIIGPEQSSRPQVVKRLWDYIKLHNLQDPSDKRYILCDSKLKILFGVDRVSMFSMNKCLSQHMKSEKEYQGDGNDFNLEGIVYEETQRKPKPEKVKKKKSSGIKRTNSGLNKPFQLSPSLAQVVNAPIMGRTDVIKALWNYIKTNNLQDPTDRRYIITDDKLKSLFNGENRISSFGMNKYLSQHFLDEMKGGEVTRGSDELVDSDFDSDTTSNEQEDEEEELESEVAEEQQ